ncbi:MAG: hypothetical protein IJS09_02505 [Treponema sp.]|nr:hypothetical protein [Treponema sp.]
MKKLLLLACVGIALAGCKKKVESEPIIELAPVSSDHKWYYFTNDNIVQIQLPQVSKLQSLKPWTENLRVSDANTNAAGNGFMLVNRLGVLMFEGLEEPVLLHDVQLFGASTADDLVFVKDIPYFTLYRSTFFNKNFGNSIQADTNRPYLVRVAQEGRMLYPALTYGDMGVATDAEIVSSIFDGDSWLAAVKSTDEERTRFEYKQWKPMMDLDAMQPTTRDGKITVRHTSEETFYSAHAPEDFSQAPSRLKSLLAAIPDNFAFSVSCYTAGGSSPRLYTHGDDGSNATALIADGWICAVFTDGTTYFNGALKGREILVGGDNVAFRLPKLPKDYYYTHFCVSGDYFAVGWEESSFYKTGRSGILVVDLGKVLYNKEYYAAD